MDGIASVNSVGAVASQFQVQSTSGSAVQKASASARDLGSNALKLIHALLGAGLEEHVLDLKG